MLEEKWVSRGILFFFSMLLSNLAIMGRVIAEQEKEGEVIPPSWSQWDLNQRLLTCCDVCLFPES